MKIENINTYNQKEFKEKFEKTNLYKLIHNDYDYISWDKNYSTLYELTSRQSRGSNNHTTVFSVVPYYYLELLIEKSPVTIYDIGCGWNIFKKYTPNIIGISAEPPDSPIFFADIHDFVDDEFVAGHQEYFESAFSINALHFHSLTKLSKVIKDFVSMIQSGGRGFLALNAQRMIERLTSDEIIKLFGTASPTKEQYTDFILECIGTVDCHFLIVDVDLSKLDDTLDGNIRIVFERIYK